VVVDDAVTVKALALTPVPAVVVTLSVPVVAPLGTVACIWVSESTVTRVAGVPFKATWVAPVTKFVPVRVTAVPTGPLVGVNDVIVGGIVGGGVPEPPFTIVKWSCTTPVLLRNLASSRLPSISNTNEPRTSSEMHIAGWFNDPPPVCPALPATV